MLILYYTNTNEFRSREPYDYNPLLVSALSVVKFKKAQMDLVRVETRSQILFSFLSVGWGLLADIDIESERLRAIGGQRFTVWTIARLIGLRTYRGKVSYLPCDKLPSVDSLGNGKTYNEYAKETQISHSRSCGDDLDRYVLSFATICMCKVATAKCACSKQLIVNGIWSFQAGEDKVKNFCLLIRERL